MITAKDLNSYLGHSIAKICPNGYANKADNHCAHFVSHVLGFDFGLTCDQMVHNADSGVNLRVQELFFNCPGVGAWEDLPAPTFACLAFVTAASHVKLERKIMVNVPRKHVGIYFNGFIWHYSNSRGKVIKQTPNEFRHHYPGNDIALFYGLFPRC